MCAGSRAHEALLQELRALGNRERALSGAVSATYAGLARPGPGLVGRTPGGDPGQYPLTSRAAAAAAPVESWQFVVLRSPWGRLGSVLDMDNRLRRMRGRFQR